MEPAASDYIVQFFLSNRATLLDNAASRTMESNLTRKQCVQQLVNELEEKFSMHSDVVRIKQHFDNRKLKITKKGQDFQRQLKRKGSDPNDPAKLPFDNEMDRLLWDYVSNENRRDDPPPVAMVPEVKEEVTDPVMIAMDLLNRHNKEQREPGSTPDSGRVDSGRVSKQMLPPEVSEYILAFFMDHHEILLDNAQSRSTEHNQERKNFVARLVDEIQERFGIEVDPVKIRAHFDNRRSRILRKGLELKSMSGGMVSITNLFDSPAEARVWDYFEPTVSIESDDSNSREGATLMFQPDKVKEESPSVDDDWLGSAARIPQLFGAGNANIPNPQRNTVRISPAPMAISAMATMPLIPPPSRKRRYFNQDPSPSGLTPPRLTDDDIREKQMELIQKQMDFYEENTKLVQKMTSAVDLLLTRFGNMDVPTTSQRTSPPKEPTPQVEDHSRKKRK